MCEAKERAAEPVVVDSRLRGARRWKNNGCQSQAHGGHGSIMLYARVQAPETEERDGEGEAIEEGVR